MNTPQLFIILAAIAAIGFLIYWQMKKLLEKPNEAQEDDTKFQLLAEQFNKRMEEMTSQMGQMRGSLDKNIGTFQEQISTTNKSINERLDKAAHVIASVSKNLGEMSEIGRQMQDFQSLLRSPKLRGGVGEFILQDLLEQTLPKESFHMQYPFKNGFVVDAALKIDKGLIGIDAKFPTENFKRMVDSKTDAETQAAKKDFQRDVKKHIDDIARKYICPDDGTTEFAVMYVPSEPVYQEIVCDEKLMQYAHNKCIWPVSPNTFLYFLKLILFGLQGQKMEEQTRKILQMFSTLRIEQEKLGETLMLVSKHARNTTNAADEAIKRHERIATKVATAKLLDGNKPAGGDGKVLPEATEPNASLFDPLAPQN